MSRIDKMNESRLESPSTQEITASYAELAPLQDKLGAAGSTCTLRELIEGEEVPILRSLLNRYPASEVHNLDGQPVLHIVADGREPKRR